MAAPPPGPGEDGGPRRGGGVAGRADEALTRLFRVDLRSSPVARILNPEFSIPPSRLIGLAGTAARFLSLSILGLPPKNRGLKP